MILPPKTKNIKEDRQQGENPNHLAMGTLAHCGILTLSLTHSNTHSLSQTLTHSNIHIETQETRETETEEPWDGR